jgi:hypothetical protein
MSEQHIAPGLDEIALSASTDGELCSSRAHRRAGCPAQVIVTLGPMGTPGQHRQALWMETWGKPYPMCAPCWQATHQVAASAAPAWSSPTPGQPGSSTRAAGRQPCTAG